MNLCNACRFYKLVKFVIKPDLVDFPSDGGETNQAEETEDSQEGDVQV